MKEILMVIRDKFIILIFIFLSSCSRGRDVGSPSSENESSLELCLRDEISGYYENLNLIKSIVYRDFLITENPQSYAILFKQISSYDDFATVKLKLSESDAKELISFRSDVGLPLRIYNCTKFYEQDLMLTKQQQKFYKSYNQSIIDGGMDNLALSKILIDMDSKSFNSNAVKEVSLCYLANYLFANYYVWE